VSLILVINPGGGSTRIAVYEDLECIMSRKIPHPPETLGEFQDVFSQREYREECIMEALRGENLELGSLDAIVGRGGALKPLESGTYEVNELLVEDVKNGNVQTEHASNLGALMAYEMASPLGIPAYMVDPVSVDEFIDEARLSGHPRMQDFCPMVCFFHSFVSNLQNIKIVLRRSFKEGYSAFLHTRFVRYFPVFNTRS